ncbi:MAG TPA: ATP-binding protein [Streptosporangiaceae bacterium]
MDVKFCLVFPREALSVPVMRHVLGDTLRGMGADDDGVADLLLAVTEACTNVVQHGGPGPQYEVVASVGRGGCQIEVQNAGQTFEVARLPLLRRRVMPRPVPVVRMRRRPARPVTFGRFHRRATEAGEMASDEAIAALPESGRGLAIMQACVDDVTLISGAESGTVVSLQKRIAWRNGAPLAMMPDEQLRDAG